MLVPPSCQQQQRQAQQRARRHSHTNQETGAKHGEGAESAPLSPPPVLGLSSNVRMTIAMPRRAAPSQQQQASCSPPSSFGRYAATPAVAPLFRARPPGAGRRRAAAARRTLSPQAPASRAAPATTPPHPPPPPVQRKKQLYNSWQRRNQTPFSAYAASRLRNSHAASRRAAPVGRTHHPRIRADLASARRQVSAATPRLGAPARRVPGGGTRACGRASLHSAVMDAAGLCAAGPLAAA